MMNILGIDQNTEEIEDNSDSLNDIDEESSPVEDLGKLDK